MKSTRGIIDRNEVVYDPELMLCTAYFHGFVPEGREETSSCTSERYIEARR
jgi:hypothetical protein